MKWIILLLSVLLWYIQTKGPQLDRDRKKDIFKIVFSPDV